MENWKDIPGYEGLYQVSDCGQVKSLERVVWNGKANHVLKEKILKPILDTCGYHRVNLWKNGKVNTYLVHRLVALAFLDGDNTLTVNHIDECKMNNHVSNLEYLTQADNVRAWIKNNPERRAESIKKAQEASVEATGQKVLDTQTNKTFPSIIAASRYMYEEEGAKGIFVWRDTIRSGKQDRFQILNS
jgi:hypothetical protein